MRVPKRDMKSGSMVPWGNRTGHVRAGREKNRVGGGGGRVRGEWEREVERGGREGGESLLGGPSHTGFPL